MDVRHYFNPVKFEEFSDINIPDWKYSMGAVIEKCTGSLSVEKIQNLDVVIMGVPFDSRKDEMNSSDAPDKIRSELYLLAKPVQKLNIADIGNLKPSSSLKGNYQALRDIVEYFHELKIETIIIGGSQDLSFGVCEAFKGNPLFSFSTIDSTLDIKRSKEPFSSSNYLSRIFSSNPELFQFSLIGYQGHYIASDYFSKTAGINSHVRLGQLRDNFLRADPILRNTDFLSFDIGAVKYSEAPAGNCMNPNGLRSEEACQLAKYAGMSERLKVFGLFEVDPEKDQFNLTVRLAAQIVWYYIDGVVSSHYLAKGLEENKIIYQVDIKNVSKPLIFHKNTITNQWWMQLQSENNKNILLGCSEEDYKKASNNDIPEMWLLYIQKIDEYLK